MLLLAMVKKIATTGNGKKKLLLATVKKKLLRAMVKKATIGNGKKYATTTFTKQVKHYEMFDSDWVPHISESVS